MKVAVCDLENKKVGDITLNPEVFSRPVRADILARVVRWQLAKRQAGTHKTKGISEISGTTRKPYKQKGTGRARQGSLRSPQFRGGATLFGPVVRSHAHDLQKRVRKLGLSIALSARCVEDKLFILDSMAFPSGKTADLKKKIEAWKGRVLFVSAGVPDEGFCKAAHNLWHVNVLPYQGLNVYDILRHDCLVLEKSAVECLEGRLA